MKEKGFDNRGDAIKLGTKVILILRYLLDVYANLHTWSYISLDSTCSSYHPTKKTYQYALPL